MLGREKHPGGETHQSKEAIKPIPSIWKIKYILVIKNGEMIGKSC